MIREWMRGGCDEWAREELGVSKDATAEEIRASFLQQLAEEEFVPLESAETLLQEVRAAIEPERLLVYEVSQGWAPLCEFLGLN